MQNSQTLKNEIISALDFLSSDNLKLLAKFVTFLRTNATQEFEQKSEILPQPARIMSPRLVHREQVADFKKEIVEVAVDDSL